MFKVNLPSINWFGFRNVYSGSLRTNEAEGILSQSVFNYKVRLQSDEKGCYISAICFYTLPWNQGSNMDEAFLGRFEASNFGIEVCENWIVSKFLANSFPLISAGALELCPKNVTSLSV